MMRMRFSSAPNSPQTAFASVMIVQAGAFCTSISPVCPSRKANSTSSTASSRLIRKRVISGFVTVISCPFLIWSIHSGTTLPRLHKTFPYRVQQILVFSSGTVRDFAVATRSPSAFVTPIALIGYAALSVERQVMLFTPSSMAAVSTLSSPITLVLSASIGKNSHEGTCLSAAAWKI